MAYNKKAQDKYRSKTKVFSLKYTPTDIIEAARLELYLSETNQSVNAYLKSLIKKDLDSKNIPYPETTI